jgi:transposase
MVTIGIDAHKRTHTLVAVDEQGRELAQTTTGTTSRDHLALLAWAARLGAEREWAVEDCRHLSRRLERDLLGVGEQLKRVPPKLMAQTRKGARTYGKSDPIDALAVARAALREEHLPIARLDGEEREIRLLVDHRDDLVQERTRIIGRLRWHLHELDPSVEPRRRALSTNAAFDRLETKLQPFSSTLARLARDLVRRGRELTITIRELDAELATRTATLAPTLLQVPGCGPVTAAKIIAETADIRRFRSSDAYARHNGTAPLPVWSSGAPRHRLSRSGNRQLNTALHRIAITQARVHPAAQTMLERLQGSGKSRREAIRILKRRLSDVVYRTLLTDAS